MVAERYSFAISVSFPIRYDLSINKPYVPSFWHAHVLWLLFVINNPQSFELHFLLWWSQKTHVGYAILSSVWFSLCRKWMVRGTDSLEWFSDIEWTKGILRDFLLLRSNKCLKLLWGWILSVSIEPKENETSWELITIWSALDTSRTLVWICWLVPDLEKNYIIMILSPKYHIILSYML